jgi:hypothetical protein
MPPVHKRLHIHLDTTHLKRALLQRGAYPLFRLGYPGEARDFLLYGGRWLEAIPEVERALYEKADNWTYAASTCTGNRGLDLRGLHLHR